MTDMTDMTLRTGQQVEILLQGTWTGPFRVIGDTSSPAPDRGRTRDHLILSGPSGTFEHYNDAPYNIRPHAG